MSGKEKSLTLIKNETIFLKIYNFFKNVFQKNKDNAEFFSSVSNNESSNRNIDNKPLNFNSFNNDSNFKLLEIQNKIEMYGIARENVIELTKDLNENEKKSLLSLYESQIKAYDNISENCKKKIIKIKKAI